MVKLEVFMPTYSDEIQLEKSMKERGKKRSKKRTNSHIKREEESITTYGKTLVRNAIIPLSKNLQSYLDSYKTKNVGQPPIAYTKLSKLEPIVVSLIATKHIFNTIAYNRPLTATAISLGGMINTDENCGFFLEQNPELYSAVKMDLDKRSYNYKYKKRKIREAAKRAELSWQEWTTTEKLHVGIRLIDLMLLNGYIEIGVAVIKKKKTKIIKATDKCKEHIENSKKWCELHSPDFGMMVMLPDNHEKDKNGGYKTISLPMIKHRSKSYKDLIKQKDMPQVYNAVNTLQRVSFKINRFVLDVMQTAWDKGLSLGGMPSTEHKPLPNKPKDIDSNEKARKEWKYRAVVIHQENARSFSKKILYAKILWEAQKHKKYSHLYFPLQLDFRSRVYCVPAFLNYQSVSGAKALLDFSHGKPVTEKNKGIFWLGVHGANMYGEDKISLQERYQWTLDNEHWILECAKDPLGNRKWEEASSAWQFLQWANEWRQFKEQGEGFVSHIPVSVDGSCNGLQLYSLMLRDKEAGKLVNVVPSEQPQDIYQLIADKVIEQLKKDVVEGKKYAQEWLQYGIKRSTTKRSIMTICYSATRYACTDFVIEDLTKRKDKGEPHPFEKDLYKPCSYLASVIWSSIGSNLTSAKVAMDFFKKCARALSNLNCAIEWHTPTGFPVRQEYFEMKSKRVKAMLMGEVIKPRINGETDKMSVYKSTNSIAPNIIHSIDSAMLLKIVNNADTIKNWCCVHDSYATTAADLETLVFKIKETFCQVFTEHDVLHDFKNDIIFNINKVEGVDKTTKQKIISTLPNVPTKGNLDLSKLVDCEYFFA